MTIFTIGHSTRPFEEFVDLLKGRGIKLLVDVRRFPASRRYPHFNGADLARSLEATGIRYHHMLALGGRRPARRDSINLGWRNTGFRGYADYMQTKEFREALEELMQMGKTSRTAVMCAEAVPWRCHRNLISDTLVVKGWTVEHILTTTTSNIHTLTSFAQRAGDRLFYPADTSHSLL